ncbi:hypothetical protein H9Q69_012904 [Fusarium xylarioides]|uniref:Uncharacterized protein n=1 Tax=Fusarium xylarioides TaxID=221167 RepID=A0A9P7L7Y9_9HYPO|nr:hypothetical protein H9Q72_007688 [Fusarium xylarioides]KAG5788028.1 hypothetical protein H9Q69_012904 [Fusarium xylarioides]KAG5812622.1 hypothetical protein H9Q71_004219 [Fusarium xylarioides]KAG5826352.1 hypothetical protein H9Q74_003592 [Fusarium xylarioides]
MINDGDVSRKPQSTHEFKVWLVTGCSSGLGKCLVSAILARGDKVIATARQLSAMKEFEGHDDIKTLSLDVVSPQDVLDRKVNEAVSFFGRIDILVNNAGYVESGVWEELSYENTLGGFETNFFGAMNMTRSVLPFMRSQKSGTIMFMGSIAAWYGAAAGGLYASTKCALEGAAESLSREVSELGINVHVFVIGRFRTGILGEKSKNEKLSTQGGIADYTNAKNSLAQSLVDSHGRQPGDPVRAAEKIVDVGKRQNLTSDQAAKIPLRIPLGAEAVAVMRHKSLDTLALLDTWYQFSAEADFEDAEALSAFYS